MIYYSIWTQKVEQCVANTVYKCTPFGVCSWVISFVFQFYPLESFCWATSRLMYTLHLGFPWDLHSLMPCIHMAHLITLFALIVFYLLMHQLQMSIQIALLSKCFCTRLILNSLANLCTALICWSVFPFSAINYP